MYVPVPKPTQVVENTKGDQITMVKELGKLSPCFGEGELWAVRPCAVSCLDRRE